MISIPAHPKVKDQSKVDVDTSAYVASHGKIPAGRGSWIFCPANRFKEQTYLNYCLSVTGLKTFNEARDIARGYFAKNRIWNIVVCP